MAMPGHDRDEYEDMDEYEDEYEDQEDQESVEDEYEGEDHQPTEQELEYLELRQKLKESIRKQMKKDPSSSLASSRVKKNTLPYNNFGSFFGPSQPVIAQRVIAESKSLLENPHLAERITKSKYCNNKVHASAPAGSRSQLNGRPHPPKATSAIKTQSKIQMLKSTRDYSFLLSDDAEPPAPRKELLPRNIPVPRPEARSAQLPPRSRESSSANGKKVFSGREESRVVPPNRQMKPKGSNNLYSASKPITSMDYRKPHGSNSGTGPGRPQMPRNLPPKTLNNSLGKRIIPPSAKNFVPVMNKPLVSKSQQAIPKQTLFRRKELQESNNGKMTSRQPMSKPQIKQQTTKVPPRVTSQQDYRKKRPARKYDDEEDEDVKAFSELRKILGYNPRKYTEDDDVSDMEANFDDILKEERRSAKIAAREDEEELRKIEEEERRAQMRKEAKEEERRAQMRKEAKKRKLSR